MTYAADPLVHFARHDREQQRRADDYLLAHASLMQEVIDALTLDSRRSVSAPGTHGHGGQPVTDVFDAYLAGPDADARRRELLDVLALAARSTDPLLRIKTFALFGACAREHADMHADEAAS